MNKVKNTEPVTASTEKQAAPPVERKIDVTEEEIEALLQRHIKVCIDNASLVTIWPLLDDMADVLLKILGKQAHEVV